MKGEIIMKDEAWELGDGKTNKLLKVGSRVELIFNTIADRKEIQKGEIGTVVYPLTPKVFKRNKNSSDYFANVDLDNGIRIRVPHGALKIIK